MYQGLSEKNILVLSPRMSNYSNTEYYSISRGILGVHLDYVYLNHNIS